MTRIVGRRTTPFRPGHQPSDLTLLSLTLLSSVERQLTLRYHDTRDLDTWYQQETFRHPRPAFSLRRDDPCLGSR